jgi:hypothetical protein
MGGHRPLTMGIQSSKRKKIALLLFISIRVFYCSCEEFTTAAT